jgi:hypothetical protein
LASGAGGGHGSLLIGGAGCGVRCKGRLPTRHHTHPTVYPCAQGGYCTARASILRVSLLKKGQYLLGASGGLQRQRVVNGQGRIGKRFFSRATHSQGSLQTVVS